MRLLTFKISDQSISLIGTHREFYIQKHIEFGLSAFDFFKFDHTKRLN